MKRKIFLFVFFSIFIILVACTGKVQSSNRPSVSDEKHTITDTSQRENDSELLSNFTRNIELTNPRMNGQDVLELQEHLLKLGFNNIGDTDGYYGPLTTGAIKKIQVLFGFEPNGKVDKNLWNFIFNNGNAILLTMASDLCDGDYEIDGDKYFSRIIEPKNPPMNGQDVLSLLARLTFLGFNGLGYDNGCYGSKTVETIKFITRVLGFKKYNPKTDTQDNVDVIDNVLWNIICDRGNDKLLNNLSLLKNYFNDEKRYNPDMNPRVTELKETIIDEGSDDGGSYSYSYSKVEYYYNTQMRVLSYISLSHEYCNYDNYFFVPNGLLLQQTEGGAESTSWEYFYFIDREKNPRSFEDGSPLPTANDAIFLYSEYKGNDLYFANKPHFSNM